MSMATLRQEEHNYIRAIGGWLNLNEADDTQNSRNRAMIAAYREEHGSAYIGKINHYETRAAIVSGEQSVYTEYTGQKVYNFGCDFCIAAPDEVLEQLIREWNTPDAALGSGAMKRVESITQRIEEIGGIQFIWT